MDQIYPDQGLVSLISRMIGSSGVKFKLFTNNITPTLSTVLADLTEASFSGYSATTITISDLTLSGVVAHTGYLLGLPLAWTNGSGSAVQCYGYYVTDVSSTMLLAVARFDSAPVSKDTGEAFVVVPSFGDFSGLTS